MFRDIEVLEKVQQWATKCVTGLKNKTYQQRLKILVIPSLEHRRKRGDLIETYTHREEDIDRDQVKLSQVAFNKSNENRTACKHTCKE